MSQAKQPLLVFADDWGRHPSSCQHLVARLLDRYGVWWVNTIGMRVPRVDRATVRRGVEKFGQWLRPSPRPERVADGPAGPRPHVLNPRMWPSFGSPFERRVNRDWLARQLAPHLAAMPAPPVALTTLPIVADLVGRLSVARWVYYCVDDFAEWPGLDGKALRALEDRLIARADVLIAVSEPLREALARRRQPVHLLTHGVDLEFWQGPGGPDDAPLGLDGLERPLVVFWGVIDRRMDVESVARLAAELPGGTVVLVGPQSDPDPALARLPRVTLRPALPLDRLPALAREAAVLVMPYADLPVTRVMQPLKLKEYLATGRPVVVRDLPATRPWADALDLADTPEAFARAVRARIATGLPAAQSRARAGLAGESWAAKARELERWTFAAERPDRAADDAAGGPAGACP